MVADRPGRSYREARRSGGSIGVVSLQSSVCPAAVDLPQEVLSKMDETLTLGARERADFSQIKTAIPIPNLICCLLYARSKSKVKSALLAFPAIR